MQTNFSAEQLANPKIAEAEGILRKCVHCGFCTATCPTYVLLGDELDSPRGRIYLIKEMLEKNQPANEETVKHVDRCLSCLACMTTCPSGVNYMHLIDQARVHVEDTYKRPWFDRMMRNVLALVMPRPTLFRYSIIAARLFKPFAGLVPIKRIQSLFALVPETMPRPVADGADGLYPATAPKKGRVGLLKGCVQSVLDPGINSATIRLLNRHGYDVVVSSEASCCGSITHHMGREHESTVRMKQSIDQWTEDQIDTLIITASGCGTTIKDYGHLLRNDPVYAEKAKAISSKAKDITEFLSSVELPKQSSRSTRIAYHSACSLQHGQKIKTQPVVLLRAAGFDVAEPSDSHLCCGSAGTYNILQPEIASQLKSRKVNTINALHPQIVATGNIGCMTQLQSGLNVPVVHTVELLDWAYGGPMPEKLTSPA